MLPAAEEKKPVVQRTINELSRSKGGGALLRRVLLLVTVAAVMAVLMVASAMPAMAKVFPLKPGQSGGGPPLFSGDLTRTGNGVQVTHCNALPGGSGNVVSRNGEVLHDNCEV
jgi:hypothetical protein